MFMLYDLGSLAESNQLLQLLLKLFMLNPHPDYNSITTVWIQHADTESCGEALANLLEASKLLDAYQIGFDVSDGATQGFVEGVRSRLTYKNLGREEGLVSTIRQCRKGVPELYRIRAILESFSTIYSAESSRPSSSSTSLISTIRPTCPS